MGGSQLCSKRFSWQHTRNILLPARSMGRGWKIQYLHNMAFLIVTKSCCGLSEECRKKRAGKKAYGKHRGRENEIQKEKVRKKGQ